VYDPDLYEAKITETSEEIVSMWNQKKRDVFELKENQLLSAQRGGKYWLRWNRKWNAGIETELPEVELTCWHCETNRKPNAHNETVNEHGTLGKEETKSYFTCITHIQSKCLLQALAVFWW